uniref:Immunoglobulin subtype domain-containing protein n=1 Tax=Callorhinchus milii TaxID=7868 RepID=A0A4W3HYH3_CALMI
MASSEICVPQFSLFVLLAIFVAGFTEAGDNNKDIYSQLGSPTWLDVWDQGSKKYTEIEWKQGTKHVAKLKNYTISSYGDFKGRAEVFQNGTLRLIHTIAADAGEYSFEIFNEGQSILKNKMQLHLLVPDSSKNHFSLLSLIIVVPLCVWFIRNQWVKRKNEDISICEECCIHGRKICQSGNESVVEENVSCSEDAQNYASIIFKDPAKRKNNEIQIPQPDHTTEYASLKVKVKNKQLYEDSVLYSTVNVQPTAYRTQND